MIVRLLCGFGRFVWGVAKVCIVLTMLAGFLLAVYFLQPVPVPAPQAGSNLRSRDGSPTPVRSRAVSRG